MNNSFPDLNILNTIEGYGAHFMDAKLWSPVIRSVCREHAFPLSAIQAGTAGTFPTFILDRRYVLKFFGPLFDGEHSYTVELEINQLLAQHPEIPAARLLKNGQVITGGDTWRYLLFDYIPGQSYRDDFDHISRPDRLSVAFLLGKILRTLHNLSVPEPLPPFFQADAAANHARLDGWFQARSRCLQPDSPFALGLPDRLAAQAADYLKRWHDENLTEPRLHLIHADLTRDHVLGDFKNGHWQINSLIDFGDGMTGNLFYELAPLHLDFFDCDKGLLVSFLNGYQYIDFHSDNFARQCLCAALQHQFNVFSGIFERHPELSKIDNLDQLAQAIWLPN